VTHALSAQQQTNNASRMVNQFAEVRRCRVDFNK